jgi:dolichol-phosphate mannosyltransferase
LEDVSVPRAQNEPHLARALVVLPTYNERENIASLIPVVLSDPRFDVLVVDDNSPDGTADIVADLVSGYPERLHLIRRGGKLGLGTAYLTGFRWALKRDYDLIFEMDSDFSHDPALLPMLAQAAESADLVLGSRYIPGGGTCNWSRLRRLISQGGSLYTRLILGLPYRDLTGGFKCFRRQALETIDLDDVNSTGYAFQIEMTYRADQAGFTIVEVPITFRERRAGKSKMGVGIMLEALVRVWVLRLSAHRWTSIRERMPGRSLL